MGTEGLAIPLPLTGREMRVTFRERKPGAHAALHTDEHQHAADELNDLFTWLAYFDEEDGTARAVSPELSLVVERPTVAAAAAELEVLVRDYIDEATERGETRDDMLRLLPRDIIATHITKLTPMLERRREEYGTAWIAGHSHMSHAPKVPATAT